MDTEYFRRVLLSIFLLGFLVLCTSACQVQVPTIETAMPPEPAPATTTPLPPSSTATASPLTPSPTATATRPPPTPTATAAPPSPTPTNTSPPSPPTPSAEELAWISVVMEAADPESVQVFNSPDQSWRAEVIRYDCTPVSDVGGELAYEQLQITGPDGQVTPVAQQVQFCGGLGAAGINGLFWSPDGRFFYYDAAREGVPDGNPCLYWHSGKFRVNLDTLRAEVLPGRGQVTPDGLGLLLVAEPEFILWDLGQGEVARSAHPFPALSVKSMAFSEDGSRVVYILREDCYQPGANSIVVVLNLADLSHTIVLESSEPSILLAAWESDDVLSLIDFNGESHELSLSTGELTPN